MTIEINDKGICIFIENAQELSQHELAVVYDNIEEIGCIIDACNKRAEKIDLYNRMENA